MTNATLRRAASRSSAQPTRRPVVRFGLLQAVIVVLILATALVHLDKALSLNVFGIHLSWLPGAMPTGPRPGGALGPGGLPGAHHPAGPPRGGMIPLPLPLSVLFFLNFLGYIVLLIAMYVPLPRLAPYQRRFHGVLRWVLIAFAAVTIAGYALIVGGNPNALGEFDKALEISLIVFLLLDALYSRVSVRQAKG